MVVYVLKGLLMPSGTGRQHKHQVSRQMQLKSMCFWLKCNSKTLQYFLQENV